MKLRDKAAERFLWKRIRKEIWQSKQLKKEYRAARKRRKRILPAWISALIFPAMAFSWLSSGFGGPEIQLALGGAIALAFTFFFAATYSSMLRTSADVMVLSCMPINDEMFLRYQTSRMMRTCLVPAFIMAVIYSWHGYKMDFNLVQWLLVACLSVMHWLLAVWLVMAMVRFRPYGRWGLAGTACLFATIASFFMLEHFPGLVGEAAKLLCIWPGYWLSRAYWEGVVSLDGGGLIQVLPILLLLPFMKLIYSGIDERFELGAEMYGCQMTAEQLQEILTEEGPEEFRLKGDIDSSMLETRNMSKPGWLELLLARFHTERESVIEGFMTSCMPAWTRAWKLSVLLACLGFISLLLVDYTEYAWFGLVLFAVGAMRGMPLCGGEWFGLQVLNIGTCCQSPFSSFPIGYWEMTRAMLKTNIVRIIAWLPFLAAAPYIICWKADLPLATGTPYAIIVPYFLIVYQFFVVGFRIFDKTSARSRVTPLMLLIVPLMFVAFASSVAGTVIMFMCREPWQIIGGGALHLVPSLTLWWVYGFLFNLRTTDMIFPLGKA